MPDDEAKQAYLDARVESAKTLSDAYFHYDRDPEAFVAGTQYALDRLLGAVERDFHVTMRDGIDVVSVNMLNCLGLDILQKAKKGEPQ